MSETHYILEIHSALGEVTRETIRKERAVIGAGRGCRADDTEQSVDTPSCPRRGRAHGQRPGQHQRGRGKGPSSASPSVLRSMRSSKSGERSPSGAQRGPPDAPIEDSEEEEEEEKTALCLQRNSAWRIPESTPEVSAPPSSASSNEAAHGADSAPQPSAPVADSPRHHPRLT